MAHVVPPKLGGDYIVSDDVNRSDEVAIGSAGRPHRDVGVREDSHQTAPALGCILGLYRLEVSMKPETGWLLFALGSALFGGITAILAKVGVTGIDSNVATFYRTLVVLALAAVIVSFRGDWPQFGSASPRTLAFLTLSGIATAASWLCYFRALQLAPASIVAPIDKLSVVIAVVLAAVFLAEPISARLLFGVALIAVGTIVVAGA
jgi:transporter family protein